MTEVNTPTCHLPWCTTAHSKRWDSVTHDGRNVLGHGAYIGASLPLNSHRSASVSIGAFETEDLGLEPPSVDVYADDARLTADEARKLASVLVEAAAFLDGLTALP
jgi:hypothetical protein